MFDVKRWLTEDLGLSADDVTLVETKLAPAGEKINAGFLRQADYSTKMNEVAAQKTELDAANARLNSDIAEWGQLSAAEKKNADALRLQIEESQLAVTAAHNKLRAVAVDAGLDVNKVFEELKVTPTTKPAPTTTPAAPDMSGFATTAHMHSATMLALTVPAELIQIAADHLALTGEHLDTRTIASELITRANTRGNQKSLDPRAVWEELNAIPAKREAKTTEKYNADIAAAETRGRNNALTEAALPTGGTPAGHAPIFQQTRTTSDGSSVLKRPGKIGPGVSSAVEALATGKYKAPVAKAS